MRSVQREVAFTLAGILHHEVVEDDGLKAFKIYPGIYELADDKTFLTVKIFNTAEQMRRYQRRTDHHHGNRDPKSKFVGMCRSWTSITFEPKSKRGKVSPEIGDILISKSRNHHKSVEIVCHEMAHAAFRYLRTRKVSRLMISRNIKWEELACHVISDLVEQYQGRVKGLA